MTVSLRGTLVSTWVLFSWCLSRASAPVHRQRLAFGQRRRRNRRIRKESSKEDGEKAPAAKSRKVPKSQSNVLLLHEDKLPLWLSYIDKPIKQQSLQKHNRSAFLCICRFGDWNFSYTATLATKILRLLPPWRVLLKRFFEPCNWTRASTTLKEHAVSKTHRKSVRDAAQLQKEDPSVAQLVAAQNGDVISANKRKLCSILDCVVNWGKKWWDGTDLCLKLCWRKKLHDVKEMIRHGWTDGAYLKLLTKIGQNLLILDTICKKIFCGQAPRPHLPKIKPSSLPLGLRPCQALVHDGFVDDSTRLHAAIITLILLVSKKLQFEHQHSTWRCLCIETHQQPNWVKTFPSINVTEHANPFCETVTVFGRLRDLCWVGRGVSEKDKW